MFPILGCRKVEHLKDSINAVTNVQLSPEEVKELEAASPIDLGFPHDLIGYAPFLSSFKSCLILYYSTAPGSFVLRRAARHSFVEDPKPIQFAK